MERIKETEFDEIGIWENYFRDRKVCAISMNDVMWKDVKKGCSQGSICGPTIWNFMINNLLNELEEKGCDVVAYADDVLLMIDRIEES